MQAIVVTQGTVSKPSDSRQAATFKKGGFEYARVNIGDVGNFRCSCEKRREECGEGHVVLGGEKGLGSRTTFPIYDDGNMILRLEVSTPDKTKPAWVGKERGKGAFPSVAVRRCWLVDGIVA